MSLSKRGYENGCMGKNECKKPLLNIGKRFKVDFGIKKNIQGSWEVVDNSEAPSYWCRKVLKNGTLSKSNSLDYYRRFHETTIYKAFD